MNHIVEQQRILHVELDYLIQNATNLLLQNNNLTTLSIVSDILSLHQYKSKQLLLLYQQSSPKHSLQLSDTQLYDNYINSLSSNSLLNTLVYPSDLESNTHDHDKILESLHSIFSGEECLGKFIDLLSFYNQFINIKGVRKVSYLAYIQIFFDFSKIPHESRKSVPYYSYISDLSLYFESFISRSKPLYDLESKKHQLLTDFNRKWENNNIQDWNTQSVDELYCQACQKQFSKQSVFDSHKLGKKHIKNQENISSKESTDRYKPVALSEYLVIEYAKILQTVVEDTLVHIERKQTLTDRERLEEDTNVVFEESEHESEDEPEKIFNPLKLPMGWDGKPIPYWLYKLHGLGVEYTCEICGNFVYMGRKAFEKHFTEWRHSHGLKCLGIPNSKHFQEITMIADAFALYERLDKDIKKEEAAVEAMEEYEDDEGNVFSKKTYLASPTVEPIGIPYMKDLKRQGLKSSMEIVFVASKRVGLELGFKMDSFMRNKKVE